MPIHRGTPPGFPGPLRPRLLLASANQGKLRELRTILDGLPVELVGLAEDEPVQLAGAVLARAEGRRRWLEFARDEVSAAELIARLLAGHEVADLTLEEPDIDDIVRRIYRGEAPP